MYWNSLNFIFKYELSFLSLRDRLLRWWPSFVKELWQLISMVENMSKNKIELIKLICLSL